MPKPITQNTLFYGDNLLILREYIPDESIDLIYLDPPFNSNRSYNVLFKQESGEESEAQITAFEDTWHWNQTAENTYHELVTQGPDHVGKMIAALRDFIGSNQMMAYLVMMAARLVELHRVLKPTGSLYLHCDPTASHYLKIVLDTIFNPENFRNEILWYYYNKMHDSRKKLFPRATDTIFFYVKDVESDFIFRQLKEKRDKPVKQLVRKKVGGRMVNAKDEQGHVIYRIKEDRTMDNVWRIPTLQPASPERLGYPTQKPVALLERIIQASSNPGDIVLDPFCGCGTAIAAAQKLGRRWIGIDITHLSIALQKYRLEQMFPGIAFKVIGEPQTLQGARQLAQDDRYQFQWWALSLIRARPYGGEQGSKKGKKGADKGIDGVITFIDDNTGKPKRIIIQVKSGKVSSRDIRDLVGTVDREKAAIGVFLTLEESTRDMQTEAVSAGFYHSPIWGRNYPRVQILTIRELLSGQKRLEMPPSEITFKQAQKVKEDGPTQKSLFD